jgi:amino acid transporter
MLAIAAGLQITVAMGPMAAELGNVQPLVWAIAALIGLVQCFFIAELAVYFPRRSGGTATYAHEAFKERAGWLCALSSWAYWFAWTPGVAVNLILAASYLRSSFFPHASTLLIGLVLGVILYALNGCGISINVKVSATLIVLTAIPLVLLVLAPLYEPSLFHVAYVWPVRFPASHGSAAEQVIKWLFVAAWSAYGAEMSSTIFAESKAAGSAIVRTMVIAGLACLVAFTVVPFVMTGIVGAGGLGSDPSAVFLVPAQAVFGSAGAKITGLMLAGALAVGAQSYIISSSRTLYQMSRDGYMPRFVSRVNRFGSPYGGIFFDATVIALLIGIFGTNVINVVAAANVGYLVVFIILPLAFVVIRLRRSSAGGELAMPRWMTQVAVLFAIANAALLLIGGIIWGTKVWLTGVVVLLVFFPLAMVRRREDARRRRSEVSQARE